MTSLNFFVPARPAQRKVLGPACSTFWTFRNVLRDSHVTTTVWQRTKPETSSSFSDGVCSKSTSGASAPRDTRIVNVYLQVNLDRFVERGM